MTHVFKSPKYQKELRKRNKSDQVISKADSAYGGPQRAPDPGLKHQAPSVKLQALKAPSSKLQAQSGKLQASSRKRQAP